MPLCFGGAEACIFGPERQVLCSIFDSFGGKHGMCLHICAPRSPGPAATSSASAVWHGDVCTLLVWDVALNARRMHGPGHGLPIVNPPPPHTHTPRRMGPDRGPPPPGFASADTPPGEGAIRMGQRYHCYIKCYTLGAAVGVMSSGKPHQSQDLPVWSCGLVAQP